jgi:hypothetical protein
MTATPSTDTEQAPVPDRDIVLAKWLRRLEDPSRPQITGRLRRINTEGDCEGMCAMGELADTLVTLGIGSWNSGIYESDGISSNININLYTLTKYLSLTPREATELQDTVVRLNDGGVSYESIARFIREQLGLSDGDTSND